MTGNPPEGFPGQPNPNQGQRTDSYLQDDQSHIPEPSPPVTPQSNSNNDENGDTGKNKQAKLAIKLGLLFLVTIVIYLTLVFTNVVSFPGSDSGSNSSSGGSIASANEAETVDTSMDLGEDAVATFTAQIKNKTDFDTAFTVEVECSGGGETLKGSADTKVAAPGEIVDAVTKIQFNPSGSFLTVFCKTTATKFLEE